MAAQPVYVVSLGPVVEGLLCSLHHFMAKVFLACTLKVTVIKNRVKTFRAERMLLGPLRNLAVRP